MVAKNARPSAIDAQTAPPSPTVTQLIKTKRYDDLAEYLYQMSMQDNSERGLLREILFAAREICLTCSILESEAEWYRRAAGEAEHRKLALERSLQTITDIIGREIARMPVTPSAPLTVIKKSASGETLPLNWIEQGVRTRFQNASKTDSRLLHLVDAVPPHKRKQVEVVETVQVLPSQVAGDRESTELLAHRKAKETLASAQSMESERTPLAENERPSMVVYGLGTFRVHLNGQPIKDWPNRKAKSIFKYLALSHARPVAREVLMECFWPDSDPEAARNNLNVAIYNLRQALRKVDTLSSHILFQDDSYLLNPDFKIWLDFEVFTEHYKRGQQLELAGELAQAVREYAVAETLYQGQLFEEDRYEDWPTSQRQILQDAYLHLLDHLSAHYFSTENYSASVIMCNKMLAVDSCREDAHRPLMQCYARQGQHYLALRQYHICVESLQKELDTLPSPETTKLYEQIRSNQSV